MKARHKARKGQETPPNRSTPLSSRQRAFIAAYAKHGIAERAAIEAGYSDRTARGSSGRLLATAGIREEVERIRGKALDKAEVSVERIVEELSIVAFADLADFVEWGFDPTNVMAPQVRLKPSAELDAAKRRGIIEVSEGQHGIKIKLGDKIAALDKLGRHRGMFLDKVEHSGQVVQVSLNLGPPPENK